MTGNCSIGGCTAGVLVEGTDAGASVINNPASITANAVGIDVNGGFALIQNSNLTGNTQAAIRAQNGATVDAGQCPSAGGNVTGLGISTGGNNLSGYGFDSASPNAIENLNSRWPDLLAYNNAFGALAGQDIRTVLMQTSPVRFTQSGGVLVTCPPSAEGSVR